MNEYDYLDQPYVADMIKRMLEHPLKPGTITHTFIEHDPWCPVLTARVTAYAIRLCDRLNVKSYGD